MRATLEAICHSTCDLVDAMGGVTVLRVDGDMAGCLSGRPVPAGRGQLVGPEAVPRRGLELEDRDHRPRADPLDRAVHPPRAR